MANYTIKDFENQQGKIFIEQNIQDKIEVMSYQEDSLPPLGELWLMKYGNANEEFYSLRIDTPVSDLNHGFLKVKKLNDDFFKEKTPKARQNYIFNAIEVDQKNIYIQEKFVTFIYDYEITDRSWDIDDSELIGKYAEEIPEHKINYETNSIGNALTGFDYTLITGRQFKTDFAEELAEEDPLEPWSTDKGYEIYPIHAIPDNFMVLLDVNYPVQPFYWGRDYKALLNEMNTLSPFSDFSSNRNSSEDGWDRDVDFEKVIEDVEGYVKENEIPLINSEEFNLLLEEELLYTPLSQTRFAALHLLTGKQLEQLLEAQIEQIQNTREGLDQAAYEVIEELEDIVEIDYWVKDLKVGIINRNQIIAEKNARLDKTKENKVEQEPDKNEAKKFRI
jgi:hypothetical protein